MAEIHPEYRPLLDNEIRLLRFDELGLRSNRFSGSLEYFNLDNCPVYFALSYVWGDATKTKTIVLDDQSFEVTVNLYDALEQIKENAIYFQDIVRQELGTPYCVFRLWVDAICINQSDHEERVRQIPKMRFIYSSAYTVLVWLGPTKGADFQPAGYAKFLQESHDLSYISAWFEFQKASHAEKSKVFTLHALVFTLFRITELPWFTRLWTIQEFLLSQRPPWALLGSGVFALQTVHDLVESRVAKIIENATGDHRDKLQTGLGILKRKNVKLRLLGQLREKLKSHELQTWTTAEQLNYVLHRTFDKASSIPHDQVYGLLGLVDYTKLPASLQIDYNTQFGELCKQIVKYVVDNTGNLNILFCMKHTLVGYPSWVPDLQYRSPSTGPTGKPLTKTLVDWSPDGQSLTVEGAFLGHVLAYSIYQPKETINTTPKPQIDREGPDMESSLTQFYDTILTASAWLQRRPLQDIWEEYLSPYEQLNNCEAEYSCMADFVSAGLDDKSKFNATKFSDRMTMQNVKQQFRTMNYGLMSDGMLLLCWPTVQYKAKQYNVDDGTGQHLVCALKGSDLLAIVSQGGEGFRLLGFCVPIRGMVLPIGNLDLDEEFFARYETRRVTLL